MRDLCDIHTRTHYIFFPQLEHPHIVYMRRIASKMVRPFDKKTNDNSFDFVVLNVTGEEKNCGTFGIKKKKRKMKTSRQSCGHMKIGNTHMKKKPTSIIIHHIFAIPIVLLSIESLRHFMLNSTSICSIQMFHPIIWAYVDVQDDTSHITI